MPYNHNYNYYKYLKDMSVKITITNAGAGISSTLDVYTNTGGSWTFFANVSLANLEAGYTFDPPGDATAYEVRDTGLCTTILFLGSTTTTTTAVPTTTTSTTHLTTTTTTAVPTTTSTTTVPTTTTSTTESPTTTTTTTAGTTTTSTTSNTTSTTTTIVDTTTTTTSNTTALPIYKYKGIDTSSVYITGAEACADVSCSDYPTTGCMDYYSYNNTLNFGDVLYVNPSMLIPVTGDYFYFSIALTDGGGTIIGPKMVVQIDNSGVIQSVSTC